jgi:TonB family protein
MVNASETAGMDNLKSSNETGKISPSIIKYAVPSIPMKAYEDRVEGFVIIKFTVAKNGSFTDPVVVEAVPPGYFENAALNALEKYKFKPATENGVAIDYTLELPFFFKFSEDTFSEDTNSRMEACRHAYAGKSLLGKAEYQEAVKEISEAINLEPKFGTAYYYRSLAYMDLEEYDKAISDIDKAIELSPGVFGYFTQRGSINLFKKDYQKAIEDFVKSIEIEPRNIVAYINRGDAFRLSGKYEEAIADYTSALVFNVKLMHVYNNRGYTYYKLKKNSQACKDFKTACELGDCRAFNHLKNKGVCKE